MYIQHSLHGKPNQIQVRNHVKTNPMICHPSNLHLPILILLGSLYTVPLSPGPDPTVNFLLGHSVSDETERDPKLRLNISIPRLIIEEEHVLIGDAARLVNSCKMLCLCCGEDLNVIEIIQSPSGFSIGRRVIRERRDDVKGFEHIACKIGSMCSRCQGERDGPAFACMDNRRNCGVEGEGFTPSTYQEQGSQ